MSLALERARMYVGGAWVGATGGETVAVRNPATGETIADVPDAGRDDVWKAIDSAAKAFPAWAALPGLERGKILHRIFELMTERRDDLARLITQENGKPFEEAKREVGFATGYFSWFSEEARRIYGDIVPPPVMGKRLWILRQPIGVVGAITPWNFPNAVPGEFDWLFEHTFFCAIPPERRADYARRAAELLTPGGRLLAIFFLDPDNDEDGPPHGCAVEELNALFSARFRLLSERSDIATYPGKEGREVLRLLVRI